MVEIYLDGTQLEVPNDISIGLSLGIADYTDPVSASGAYTQTVEIPRTPHNDKAVNFSGEVLSVEQYNHAEHTARIVQDGCELIGGKAYLEGVSQRSYSLQIVGEEIEWVAKIRSKKFSELEGESIGTYRPTEWDELCNTGAELWPKLSWVLLQHGCWFQEADDEKIRRSWITYNDLVPIVKLHTLLEHIFSRYEIVASDSLKELLLRTYTTMKWAQAENASVLNEDMGFEITSNLLSADPESGEFTVTIDENNRQPIMSLFDTIVEDKHNVLSSTADSNGIVVDFHPKYECVGSLELKTRYQTSTAFYTTTFQDKDGGWDDVAIGNPMFADQLFQRGEDFPFVQFSVEDSLEWGAKTLLEAKDKIRDEAQGIESEDYYKQVANMPLCVVEIDNPELYESIGYVFLYQKTTTSGTSSGTTVFSTYRPTHIEIRQKQIVRANQSIGPNLPGNSRLIGMYIALRGKNGLLYVYNRPQPYYHNGFVYYGDAEAVGVKVYSLSTDQRLTFDVALQMPPKKFDTSGTYEVSRIAFGSSTFAHEGSITVYGSAEGSIKPDFGWGVPIRSQVKLSDIGGETTAESMLRSIMHLYNLIVYTNPKTKQVFLYSFSDYWNNNIVDWRDRIDADSDISTTYIGDSIGKEILLSFAEGSPRIDYYNDRHKLPYSAYKKALPNKLATEAKEVQNEVLTPPYMVRIKDEFGEGEGFIPAVALPDKEGDVLEFNLADVPNTLLMIDTSAGATASMPPLNTAVFGDVGGIQPSIVETFGDTTLSFSDKDGKVGLHKHYDRQIALWEKAKRLTCYCRVEAWEIEALRYNVENINFRSLFHLNINGEDIYARLESIEYEPTNATNKCTFIIE